MKAMDDHAVCKAVREGRYRDIEIFGLTRAIERGLVDAKGLTRKGNELLDGIEPTACSGWHMGGAAPVGDWRRR